MEKVVNIFEQMISLKKNRVHFEIDKSTNVIWFRFKDVAKIIDIKDVKSAAHDINKKYKSQIKNLNVLNKHDDAKNTVYINEYGIYDFLFKSRKKIAIEFRTWLIEEVLPSLRETGMYTLNEGLKSQLKDLQNQLNALKTEYNKLISSSCKIDKYRDGGFVYIITLEYVNGKAVYKLGSTDDLHERLRLYNIGRSIPLDYDFTLESKNPLCVENCARAILAPYKFMNSKDKFICELDQMKKALLNCNKTNNICKHDSLETIETTSNTIQAQITNITNYMTSL